MDSHHEHIFKCKDQIEIPSVHLSEFVFSKCSNSAVADKPAFIDGTGDGRKITFGQVVALSKKVAQGLSEKGLKKGMVFAIYAPNLPEYAIAFHGVILTGAAVTTVNPLYTVDELVHQLKDSGATYLLTIPVKEFLDKAKAAAKIVNIPDEHLFVFGQAEGAVPFASLMNNDGKNVPKVDINPKEDVVALPYSSGTTGLAKGVVLTHHNLVANILQVDHVEGKVITKDDVLVGVLPFFHIYGMIVVLNCGLVWNLTTVVMSRFDLEKFLQLVQEYKISWCHLVPPICLGLAKHPAVAKYNISSIKSIISGAAPMGPQLQEELSKKLSFLKLRQGYGMTELSPVSHLVTLDDIVFGSVGKLLPNCEAKIVNTETGKTVGVEEAGELCIRGPNVMKGYLNKPDATKATIKDGWLYTGDICKVDKNGNFFVVDRLKELIKYNGYQVAPAELEALLLSHPSVADCSVIGVPDLEAGELPKAFVVLKPDHKETTGEAIANWIADRVAPTKKLRGGVEFVEAIPKSASGKILRRVLKDKELASRAK